MWWRRHIWGSFVLSWLSGPGLAQSTAAIAETRKLAYSPSLASALMIGAMLLSIADDNGTLDEWADELVAVAADQGVPWWSTVGTVYRG